MNNRGKTRVEGNPQSWTPPLLGETNNLLAFLQTGLALGLLGRMREAEETRRKEIQAGARAGITLRHQSQDDPLSQASLWVDIAKHGAATGRYTDTDENRPTIIGQAPDVSVFLHQLWDAAFMIGQLDRKESEPND